MNDRSERMRLSSGPVYPGNPDRGLFGYGLTVVRCGNRSFDKSRKLVEIGVGMRGPGREATIFRRPRAESYAHTDLSHDRLLRSPDADAKAHTDASSIWCLPLHGCGLAKGTTILR